MKALQKKKKGLKDMNDIDILSLLEKYGVSCKTNATEKEVQETLSIIQKKASILGWDDAYNERNMTE